MWGRYRRWPRFKPLFLATFVTALAGWLYFQSRGDERVRLAAFSEPAVMLRAGQAEVVDVIDGETLLLKQPAAGKERKFVGKVRLLGIISPNAKHGEAVAFLKKLTESGVVSVELDKRRVDRDSLFLAYVYAANGKHLSEELVAAGLARVQTYPGDSMSVNRKLQNAQDAAKREERGIWNK